MPRQKLNPFLEYLLSKYENKFIDTVLDFAVHHIPLLKEKMDNDRLYIKADNIEVYDLNPITTHIELIGDDTISFDVVFNPMYECYCEYGRHRDYESENVDLWLSIPGKATLSKELKDISFGWCRQYEKNKPQKPLEGNLIRILSKDEYEEVATDILQKYFPEGLRSPTEIDVDTIARRMELSVINHQISQDGKSFGRVVFDDTICELYDSASGRTIERKIPKNTIIIDCAATSVFSLGSKKITLAHEIVHYYLHKIAFIFAKIIHREFTQLECKNGGVVVDEDDPMRWFEIQANGIAPCIAMPPKQFMAKYKEYENRFCAESGNYVDAVENIINALAEFFGVTRYSVKKRLMDLGIEDAQGAFNYVDGHYVRSYLCKKGSLGKNETYTISFKDFVGLMDNVEHMAFFYKGEYSFVENHLCLNTKKYIAHNDEGVESLTDYARAHLDECCLKFKCKSLDTFIEKSTYNTFCYLCRDLKDDLKVNIDFSADNQLLFKSGEFRADFERHTKAVADLKKAIYGLSLSETLSKLQELLGWQKWKMAQYIGVSERTIKRYLKGEGKKPSRGKVIAMCLRMGLTAEVTSEVLRNGDLAITGSSIEDKALISVIETCRFKSITEINEILTQLGCSPLTTGMEDEN